jgi:fatty acid amide hydrolase 2
LATPKVPEPPDTDSRRTPSAPLDESLLVASATELAARIRRGEVTSRQVVDTHIAHSRRVNLVINAIVEDRYDEARAEADAADAARRRTSPDALPPLHGVPCTIKESFSVEGMPNTAGLVSRRDVRAESDAPVVARLRAAGAIPIGVTNVSELCMWMESSNRVYGRSNNPYDPSRIVGGSSGGEGAIVGSGASPIGLGADIGGSIRMPAFFNGVFGHKPTGGMVPATGQFPIAHGDALRMLGTGPLARRAEDLWPLLRILAGPDGQDPACRPWRLEDPAGVDMRSLTVLDVQDDGKLAVDEDLRRAQRLAAEALAEAGAKVRRVSFEGFARATDMWSARLHAAGGPSFAELLGDGRADRSPGQLVRWARRRSPHTLPAILLAILETVPARLPGLAKKMLDAAWTLRAEVAAALGDRSVILYPVHPKPAPPHYEPLRRPFQVGYTAVFNVLELPATAIPLGLGREGVPLGVQVAANLGRDHLTLAVARVLEDAFGGWVPPWTAGRTRHGR